MWPLEVLKRPLPPVQFDHTAAPKIKRPQISELTLKMMLGNLSKENKTNDNPAFTRVKIEIWDNYGNTFNCRSFY